MFISFIFKMFISYIFNLSQDTDVFNDSLDV